DGAAGGDSVGPLVAPDAPQAASSRSRDHLIVQGSGGMITVAGGKLTTYRVRQREVVARAIRELRFREGRSRPGEALTDEEPLPGGETDDFGPFPERGLELGVLADSVEHRFGSLSRAGAGAGGAAGQRGAPGAALRARGGGDLQPGRRRPPPPAPA